MKWKCKECGEEVTAKIISYVRLDRNGNYEKSTPYSWREAERNEELKYKFKEYECIECGNSSNNIEDIAKWVEVD